MALGLGPLGLSQGEGFEGTEEQERSLWMMRCRVRHRGRLIIFLLVWTLFHDTSGFSPLPLATNASRSRRATSTCSTTSRSGAVPGRQSLLVRQQGHDYADEQVGAPSLRSSCAGSGHDEDVSADEKLSALMKEAGVGNHGVSIQRGEERGLGVFSSRPFSKGDVVLTVPLSACILSERYVSQEEEEEILGRPRDTVPTPEALTWDVRLAYSLLQETEKEGTWWSRYSEFLPARGSFPQPSCLPEQLLLELQHDAAEQGGRAQQDRLRMLFPSMMPPRIPDQGQEAPLQWAFACVRSRAYAASPPKTSAVQYDVDTFAFVPFFDLINHGEEEEDGHLDSANTDCHACPERQAFELFATRDVEKGEELLTCYKPRMDNRIMFALYGFVPSDGNPNDSIDVGLACPCLFLCMVLHV